MALVTIHSRKDGSKFAYCPQARGPGLRVGLRTRSMEEARQKVKDAKLEEIARAAQADALTREVWTRLLAGRNVLVREAVEAYREHCEIVGQPKERDHKMLDEWLRFTGIANESIAIVDTRHVADWVNRESDRKLRTRQWWLQVLKSFLQYCVDQRWIVKNPAIEIVIRLDRMTQEQLVSKPFVPFTEDEVKKLLGAIPRADFWHGATLFGYHFGLRLSAVATLEESNIVAHQLRVYTTKGRRIVHERLPDDLIAWLEEWRPLRPASDTPYLFPVQASIVVTGGTFLSEQFRRICKRHGIQGKSFHGLRKTATQNRWNVELDELGDADARRLMGLVAQHGMKKVQEMLAHAPGSDVTAKHYFNQPPK